jgi:hypothetical protein
LFSVDKRWKIYFQGFGRNHFKVNLFPLYWDCGGIFHNEGQFSTIGKFGFDGFVNLVSIDQPAPGLKRFLIT